VAAPLFRPVIGGPPLLVQNALPADDVRLFDLMAELQSLADILRQVVADKAAQLVAKGKLFGAETEIHQGRSSVRRIYNQDWPDRATKRRSKAILQIRLVREARAGSCFDRSHGDEGGADMAELPGRALAQEL